MRMLYSLILVLYLNAAWAINPMKAYQMKPDQFQIEYKERKIETADQYALNVWEMKTTAKRKRKRNITILIAGSDAGNMGFSLPYAAALLNQGFDVITFDYRGFGESAAFDFKATHLYHQEYIQDFETIMNWVKKDIQPDKVGVLAFSMGTFIASAGYTNAPFDFFIGEAFIRSPKVIVKRIEKVKNKSVSLPENWKADFKKARKMRVPVMLINSETDQINTTADCHYFAKNCPDWKVLTFKGDHLRGALTMGMDDYVLQIIEHVNRIFN